MSKPYSVSIHVFDPFSYDGKPVKWISDDEYIDGEFHLDHYKKLEYPPPPPTFYHTVEWVNEKWFATLKEDYEKINHRTCPISYIFKWGTDMLEWKRDPVDNRKILLYTCGTNDLYDDMQAVDLTPPTACHIVRKYKFEGRECWIACNMGEFT